MRWMDDMSTDLRKKGISEWRDRARYRETWKAYCKGGQGPPRAVAPPKKKKKYSSVNFAENIWTSERNRIMENSTKQ